MDIPQHIQVITDQIEAMRKDGHDENPYVSIRLDAIEYEKDELLRLLKNPPLEK